MTTLNNPDQPPIRLPPLNSLAEGAMAATPPARLTPTEFIAQHTAADSDAPLMDECPICLDYFCNEPCVRITGIEGCNHRIGRTCLKKMLTVNPMGEKKCPLCRTTWITGQTSPQGQRLQDLIARRGPASHRFGPRSTHMHELLRQEEASALALLRHAQRQAMLRNQETMIDGLDHSSNDSTFGDEEYRSTLRDIAEVRHRASQTGSRVEWMRHRMRAAMEGSSDTATVSGREPDAESTPPPVRQVDRGSNFWQYVHGQEYPPHRGTTPMNRPAPARAVPVQDSHSFYPASIAGAQHASNFGEFSWMQMNAADAPPHGPDHLDQIELPGRGMNNQRSVNTLTSQLSELRAGLATLTQETQSLRQIGTEMRTTQTELHTGQALLARQTQLLRQAELDMRTAQTQLQAGVATLARQTESLREMETTVQATQLELQAMCQRLERVMTSTDDKV